MSIDWRIGVEIETVAPRGRSRLDLARAIAGPGRVRRFFHAQSEPALVPGTPVFESLTLGFEALDPVGAPLARFVDDLTLRDDCDRDAPPRPGWYRIVSDDGRMLRLLARHADPEADLPEVLAPFAALFGTTPEARDGMWKVTDAAGAWLAIGAPLPGERERPCEIITPPLDDRHEQRLAALLDVSRAEGFLPAAEGAVHLHFDAARCRSGGFVREIVRAWHRDGAAWRERFRTNPRCTRLGPPPAALVALVERPGFADRPWEPVRADLLALGLEKWVDVNLTNLLRGHPAKDTVEIRLFPAWTEAGPITDAMAHFAGLFERWIRR